MTSQMCERCGKIRVNGGYRLCFPCRGKVLDAMYKRGELAWGNTEFGGCWTNDEEIEIEQKIGNNRRMVKLFRAYRPSSFRD